MHTTYCFVRPIADPFQKAKSVHFQPLLEQRVGYLIEFPIQNVQLYRTKYQQFQVVPQFQPVFIEIKHVFWSHTTKNMIGLHTTLSGSSLTCKSHLPPYKMFVPLKTCVTSLSTRFPHSHLKAQSAELMVVSQEKFMFLVSGVLPQIASISLRTGFHRLMHFFDLEAPPSQPHQISKYGSVQVSRGA